MMFAAVPPSRMIPWTRAVGRELLAPQADRAEQGDHRVERVPALPRIGDGVGLQPGEDDLDVLRRERMALDVVPVARVVQQRGIDAGEQAVIDHDLLAASPFLGRRPEEHDLARAARRRPRPGRSRRRPRTRPSCCGRSRGRDPAARRTRRGSRSAGRRRRGRRGASPGPPSPGCPPGARPRTRARARTSATQVAAWCSSNAGSGLAWIRCDRSRISSRAPSTAAAIRVLRSTCGSAGRTAVRSGTGPPGRCVCAAVRAAGRW